MFLPALLGAPPGCNTTRNDIRSFSSKARGRFEPPWRALSEPPRRAEGPTQEKETKQQSIVFAGKRNSGSVDNFDSMFVRHFGPPWLEGVENLTNLYHPGGLRGLQERALPITHTSAQHGPRREVLLSPASCASQAPISLSSNSKAGGEFSFP